MSDLIAELRHHEQDYPSLVHGPLCGLAADEIGRLRKALEGINSQAVCACIAKEDECFQMLQNCAEISDAALAQPPAERLSPNNEFNPQREYHGTYGSRQEEKT